MANNDQQKPQKDPTFFESLPLAGDIGNWAGSVDWKKLGQQVIADSKRAALRTFDFIHQSSQSILPFTRAAAYDTAQYSNRAYHAATSRAARRVYKLAIAIGAITATVGFAFLATATYSLYSSDLVSPTTLLAKKNTGTTILDRNGQVLYQVYGANNRQPIHLQDLSPDLIHATLAAEDPGFYDHSAVSWRATGRALYTDLIDHGRVQGGSTITQQLVKNALLSPDKSLTRKAQEIILATEVEKRYSKDQILEMYFNAIYYGEGSDGIESAAQTYFHKPAKDLDLSESAMLAGMPLCPGACDPNFDLSAATGRRNYILDRMKDLGMISADRAEAAKAEPIQASARQVEIHAPHFVFYVLDQLRQQYGDDLVEHGGITVYTTLDLKKQEEAQRIVQQQIDRLASHHATNGGLISLNPNNGEILTMVGSVDYYNSNFGNVNVTMSDLQPGSSIKPIVYAEAFAKGWNGATTVDDLPIHLPDGSGQIYSPSDYDGKWRGHNIRLRRALANSLNIPAIHVIQFTGVHDAIGMAHNLGITGLNDESRYGVSLVLGGGEVKPVDMATAYSAFANGGNRITPKAVLKVNDKYGHDITKPDKSQPVHVLDPRIGYMISSILSDNGARTEEFGPNSPLKLSHTAAAKTGTTNDFRDNWTVGYTPDIVTAVWVGNNDHSPMLNVDGISGAAPIWHDYMEFALRGTPDKQFAQPAGIVVAKVCAADGGLANAWDSGTIQENFLAEAPQTKKCSSTPPPPPQPTPTETPTPAQDNSTPSPFGSGGPAATPPNSSPSPGPSKPNQP